MTTDISPPFLADTLPRLERHKPLVLGAGDVFIHSPGFEDRTMAFNENTTFRGGARAILIDYRPLNPDNKLALVRKNLLLRGVDVSDKDIIKYDRFKPANFDVRLKRRLQSISAKRAFIDISTMSKLLILIILHECNRLDLPVEISYSEPQSYGPTKEEFERGKVEDKVHQPSIQIFTGVFGVVRVDSLASVAMQGQPTAAIVFMSFNDVLTQVLLNTVYPGRLLLINGRPPVHDWREEATAWIHNRVRREWSDDNPFLQGTGCSLPLPERAVSTLYYEETVRLLLELYWELSVDHRILLAPSGSKLQAVGCYLVKALHPDVHIEYPSPAGFFRSYSTGIGSRWFLNLGRISALTSKISEAEYQKYLRIPIRVSSELG